MDRLLAVMGARRHVLYKLPADWILMSSMSGPLDVWFDDLVVDTSPVACP